MFHFDRLDSENTPSQRKYFTKKKHWMIYNDGEMGLKVYYGNDGDDIYIMMKCVCVCHEKSSLPTCELSAGGAK